MAERIIITLEIPLHESATIKVSLGPMDVSDAGPVERALRNSKIRFQRWFVNDPKDR